MSRVDPVWAIADDYLLDLAEVDGTAAELVGRPFDVPLPRVGPEHLAAALAAARRARARLEALPTGRIAAGHEDGDPALRAALTERLDAEIALHEGGFTPRLLAPLATPVHAIRSTFDAISIATPQDRARAVEALAGASTALADYRRTLEWAADRGHVVGVRQIHAVAAQCRQWVLGDDFYGRYAARLAAAATPAEAAAALTSERAITRAAEQAGAATLAFADWLESDLAPRATSTDAVGRDLYTVTARAFLGCDVDLDETVAWGWAELDRIAAEMAQVARAIHPDGIDAAIAALDADPTRRLHGTEDLERWLNAHVARIADHLDGRYVDLPSGRARLPECAIATAASGVMHYAEPDPGLTRPGRVWWSVDEGVGVRTWRDLTTVHHEAIPGHHLQIATALTAPDLHPWQRSMCHVHGHAEGWAHWAEEWAGRVGLLEDPGDRLGMLVGQAWRAARIVIDAGLHLGLAIPSERRVGALAGADRWSYDVAVAFLREVSGLGEASARFEVDRYLGWPAQALSFRVGARLFESIHAPAAATGRKDRDILGELLARGPMGLGPLAALTAPR